VAVLLRTWLGLLVIGAGLIDLAVAAGAPPLALVVFAVLGVAECAWGAIALARERIPAPRLGLAAALTPIVAWALLAAPSMAGMAGMRAPGTSLPVLPLAAASALGLVAAILLTVVVRRGVPTSTQLPRTGAYLAGVLLGCFAVAAVTSTAMGGTLVGSLAMRSMGGMH
jgi:hypothetical protein